MTKDLLDMFIDDKKFILYPNTPENNIVAVFKKDEIYESKGSISDWLWTRLVVKKSKKDKTGIRYKHRVYYRNIFEKANETKILTIVMFNPSYANQYSNDGTINNCIKIAKDNGYNCIEVINMLTVRDPDIIRAINEPDNNAIDFIKVKDYFRGKDVLLAWGGYGKLSIDERGIKDKLHNKFLEILKDSNRYTFSKDLVNGKFPRHPSPKSFNNAKIERKNNKIILQKYNW